VFFAIGRIVAPHGVRGEVKMEIFTDRPERIADLRRVYFDDDPTPVPLAGVRLMPKQVLLKFPHINDRDEAATLRGTVVRVSGSQLPPQENDTYYHYQLIDLAVFDEGGTRVGTLAQILPAGEVDVYVVRDAQGREQLFPALKEVVLSIDLTAGRIVVRPLEWDTDE
jgi:16S rRNA processing protein RimM